MQTFLMGFLLLKWFLAPTLQRIQVSFPARNLKLENDCADNLPGTERERITRREEMIVWEIPLGIKSCSFRNSRRCLKRSHCFNISQHSQPHRRCARKQRREPWRRTLYSWKFIMNNSVMTKGRTQKHFLGGGENRDSIWREVFLDEHAILFTFLY